MVLILFCGGTTGEEKPINRLFMPPEGEKRDGGVKPTSPPCPVDKLRLSLKPILSDPLLVSNPK